MADQNTWGNKEQIETMVSIVKDVGDIVVSIEKRSQNCDLSGISKEIFSFERDIGTYLVAATTKKIQSGIDMPKFIWSKMNELKVRYDSAINNIDKNCVCLKK